LFRALKNPYKYTGASAEFYARQKYDNAKISDYNSVSDYLMKFAHLVNKEVTEDESHIGNRIIAMRLIRCKGWMVGVEWLLHAKHEADTYNSLTSALSHPACVPYRPC
jgi:hypothetical protein